MPPTTNTPPWASTNPDEEDDCDDNDEAFLSNADVMLIGGNYLADIVNSMFQTGLPPHENGHHLYTMQVLAILPRLLENVENYRRVTVRCIYYEFQQYFYSYNATASFLRSLASRMNMNMIHLNVVPNITTSASMVASEGFFTISNGVEKIEYYPTGGFNGRAHHLPDAQAPFFNLPIIDPPSEQSDNNTQAAVDGGQIQKCTLEFQCQFSNGSTTPDCLIVSEKSGWLNQLKEQGILKKLNCIMINTQGIPSYNVLAFVKMFHRKYQDVKIVGLFDCAPSGFFICQKFYFALSYQYLFSVPIVFAGLLPSAVIQNGTIIQRMKSSAKSFTNYSADKHLKVIDSPWMWHSSAEDREKATSEMDMLRGYNGGEGVTCNMNGFKPASGTLTDYVLDIIENKKYLAGPPTAGPSAGPATAGL